MKKPPPHPKRRGGLSKEDEALWEHTAATLKPLRSRKSRHVVPGEAGETEDARPKPPGPLASPKAPTEAATRERKPAPSQPSPPPPAPPDLNTFDRKAARKLRQGHFEIEARIDLHGLRQHEAHGALRRFLMSAFAKGQRWVLVITGKGAPRLREEEDQARPWGTVERGVLRRNVPMWLAEPELRAIVVSYTTAAIPHGGEGALYIQLRNPDRGRK
jgi:DNA-nicking Smr family endonuclease